MVKKLERRKNLQFMERRELIMAPELGHRIAEIFCGLRDLLIAPAESEGEIEPDGVGRAVTLPLDGNSAGAHSVARRIAQTPRDGRRYPGEIAGHCPSPDDCAQH